MDEWYYAKDGESVGPVAADVAAKIVAGAGDQVQLVWSPGMADWVDGRTVPELAPPAAWQKPAPSKAASRASPGAPAAAAAMDIARGMGRQPAAAATVQAEQPSLLGRVRHEMISYLAITAYLLVWFMALMFYKSTILRGVGVDLAPFGVAALLKSTILAKFIIILEKVKLGERRGQNAILIVQIVIRALLFTLALIVMSLIEEVVVGYFHGHDAKEALSGIAAGSLPQVFATATLMFLVLVPYLAFRRIALEIGELPELLFTRRGVGKQL